MSLFSYTFPKLLGAIHRVTYKPKLQNIITVEASVTEVELYY